MNFSAIFHRASENQCYAVDENTIEIKVKTGYDVDKVNLYYGDPFDGGILGGNWKWNGEQIEFQEVYELEYHKVWVIRVIPKHKRLKYYFEFFSGDEKILFFEDGFLSHEQAQTKSLQCFTMPWINPSDVAVTPSWAKAMIWYQIFPDRFCKLDSNKKNVVEWGSRKPSNEDIYGGDLKGIISKLDYIKSFGVTGIYLNPIFKALATHKYDTTDYYEIDEMFGDKETFKEFVTECHKRNIKVMLDGVFNHCGVDFAPWQDVLKNGQKSKYFDWFMINQFPFDTKKDHTRDSEFYSFAFTSRMPKLNTNNQEVIEYIKDICKYWIREYDIDAWRLDVANEISHLMCKKIRTACREVKKDVYILGEIWHDSIDWLRGDEFDAVMNYPLTTAINDFWFRKETTNKDFEHSVNNCYQRYTQQTNAVTFNLLDSHDTDRLYHRVGKNQNVFYQQLAILFTMPGAKSIYYGTEIMMDGAHDPDCRACMPWQDIESGKYDEHIKLMQDLTYMHNTEKAFKSQKIRFENSYGLDRVIEYVRDDSVRVIINASEKELPILVDEGKILFKYRTNAQILLPEGVIIHKL